MFLFSYDQRSCTYHTNSGKKIKEEIEIELTQTELFDLTQDYSKRLEWDPYLKEAYLLNKAKYVEEGVESCCKNHYGSAMISKYISFNRPSVAAISMTKGPLILKKFCGAWNVKKMSNTRSLLVFTYNFELIGDALGKIFIPIASYLFAKDMKKRLLAIKLYVENNKT